MTYRQSCGATGKALDASGDRRRAGDDCQCRGEVEGRIAVPRHAEAGYSDAGQLAETEEDPKQRRYAEGSRQRPST